jgi:hypothetical protein
MVRPWNLFLGGVSRGAFEESVGDIPGCALADAENSRTRWADCRDSDRYCPETVTYELTSLGLSLHETVRQLKLWPETHHDDVSAHQAQFDDAR